MTIDRVRGVRCFRRSESRRSDGRQQRSTTFSREVMETSFDNRVSTAPNRGQLAKMAMRLLDHWQLGTADQAALLGIPATNMSALTRYRRGYPIGASRDQYDRIGHLLEIHRCLRQLFPQNRDLVYRWIQARNKAFDNLTPVEVIKDWGFAGLLRVRCYLDRALHV